VLDLSFSFLLCIFDFLSSPPGSHGASKYVQIIAFPTVEQAVAFLHNDCHCPNLIGLLGPCPGGYDIMPVIETDGVVHAYYPPCGTTTNTGGETVNNDNAALSLTQQDVLVNSSNNSKKVSYPVHTRPFSSSSSPLSSSAVDANAGSSRIGYKNTCWVVSKRVGLPISLAQQCTQFVHVAQQTIVVPTIATTTTTTTTTKNNNNQGFSSPPPTLSSSSPLLLLDTPACLSIALHEFTECMAGQYYGERPVHGHKFQVEQPMSTVVSSSSNDYHDRTIERCREKLETALQLEETLNDGAVGGLFAADAHDSTAPDEEGGEQPMGDY